MGGGVGGGVELYRPGIFIYIYNSETPPRLRGDSRLEWNDRLLRWAGVGRKGKRRKGEGGGGGTPSVASSFDPAGFSCKYTQKMRSGSVFTQHKNAASDASAWTSHGWKDGDVNHEVMGWTVLRSPP